MIVTIHQPEHFPYMGFFQKASLADVLILLDNVKFRKNYYQNRNQYMDKAGKIHWFTVPVSKGSTSLEIKDVKVSNDPTWKKKLVTSIRQNLDFDISRFYDHNLLVDINCEGIEWAFKELGIKTKIIRASNLDSYGKKSELLANLCKSLDAKKYISGPSGKDYLDMSFFENIDVEFFQPKVKNNLSCLYNICKGDTCLF